MNTKEVTKKSYNSTATQYTANVQDIAPLESIEKFVKALPTNGTLLDLGCGSGRDAKIFSDKGLSVTGIDFSEEMIKIAREKAPKANFHVMDIEENTLKDTFDGIWANCSLVHIARNNLPNVLALIRSLLKEQGQLYISLKTGNKEGVEGDIRYEGSPEKFWSYHTPEEMTALLKESGFEILDHKVVGKHHSYINNEAMCFFCKK